MGGGVALVLIAAVALSRLQPAAPSVSKAVLWVDEVHRGEMLVQVSGPGTLIPRQIRWLSVQSQARVERILVRAGAAVKADTVVTECSDADLLQETAAARFQLESARAALADARVRLQGEELDQRVALAGARSDYESAKLEMEAEKPLAAQGIVPAVQYRRSALVVDQLKVKMDATAERLEQFAASKRVRLAAQQAQLDQMKALLDRRNEQVAALQVRAGIAGVVQEVLVEEGQRLTPGTNVARVANSDDLQARLQVPESQAHYVQLGQSVDVDTRNGIANGRVSRIDPAVQGGVVRVDVDFDRALPPGSRPDLAVDGTIQIERLKDVLYVARPAFAQSDSATTLFRVTADGREALRIPVRLGRVSAKSVEILQGLNAADQVILSDTSAWSKYPRLRLNN